MQPHLDDAHKCWGNFVHPGDTVVDATLGNGFDTAYLAQLLKGHGKLVGYDIQLQALEQTKKRLESLPPLMSQVVTLKMQSHVHLEEENIKLIVYNLGYLPGGDKSITTLCDTTLQSIKSGMSRLKAGGAISITCYPGHLEGAREQSSLLEFLKTLPSKTWSICHHQWINRSLSPTWLWLQSVHDA